MAFFAGHDLAADDRFFEKEVTHPRSGLLVFVYRLGNDVASAGQGRFNGIYGECSQVEIL
jgi:hypothetical protein